MDEIFPVDPPKNIFSTKIILDIRSSLFPPFHTRFINITGDLLEADFYESMIRKFPDLPRDLRNTGSIVQGGYYKIPKHRIPANIFKPLTIVAGEFRETLKDENLAIIDDIFYGGLAP